VRRHNVGVIGRGVWGCHSLEQEMAKFDEVRIVAVNSDDRWGESCFGGDSVGNGKKYAAELGAEFRDDWREIVRDPDIDIISLMTCPASRLEPAIAAFSTGKHIVVDKPLAKTTADAEKIVAAEKKSSGKGFMLCGYHLRPTVQRLKVIINNGQLGELRAINVRLSFTGGIFPGFTPSKRWISETIGGELTTIGSHALQTLLWLTDQKVESLYARRGYYFYPAYHAVGAEDWAEVSLQFTNRLIGHVVCSRLPYKVDKEPFVVEVTGTDGFARIESNKLSIYPDGKEFADASLPDEVLSKTFASFFKAIETDSAPPTTFEDGLILNRIWDAAYRSAGERKVVTLE